MFITARSETRRSLRNHNSREEESTAPDQQGSDWKDHGGEVVGISSKRCGEKTRSLIDQYIIESVTHRIESTKSGEKKTSEHIYLSNLTVPVKQTSGRK